MELFLFPALITLGLFGYWSYTRWQLESKAIGSLKRKSLSGELALSNASLGAMLNLSRIGEELRDFSAQVIAIHTVRLGSRTWYEFECDSGEAKKVFLELHQDADRSLYLQTGSLSLQELRLDGQMLQRMRSSASGSFSFQEIVYNVTEVGTATYYRESNHTRAEELTLWNLSNSDGSKTLSIEQSFGSQAYRVKRKVRLQPSQIQVLSLAGESE